VSSLQQVTAYTKKIRNDALYRQESLSVRRLSIRLLWPRSPQPDNAGYGHCTNFHDGHGATQ